MEKVKLQWEKLGRIIEPGPQQSAEWLHYYAGPSFARVISENVLEIFSTGRDSKNRSSIGIVHYDLDKKKIIYTAEEPVMGLGERGTFDEMGVSYPWIVESDGKLFMYYVGWMLGVTVPFINEPGLAVCDANSRNFKRVSRAPIIPRTNEEPIGAGSVSVLKDEGIWKAWYTCFYAWGKDTADPKHLYHIKYAESPDGINWKRDNIVAVNYDASKGEFVTGRPSVIKFKGKYLMWFSYRGEEYRMGFAISDDGKKWSRRDEDSGISPSAEGWDSKAVCYSYVFMLGDYFYMLHNGNNYGKTGLGLARIRTSDIADYIDRNW